MPVDLTLHGDPVGTVFDLLGHKENDITYSVGWAMAQCAELTTAVIEDVLSQPEPVTIDIVQLQEFIPGSGYTDIEIKGNEGKLHLIVEAKRGYNLPAEEQLIKYVTRTDPQPDALVVMAEASADFVAGKLPPSVEGVPVHYRPWRRLDELVTTVVRRSRNHAEKRLLRELSRYLRGLMTMQNVNSNLVYVVALGGEIEETGIGFQEVVTKHDTYFCPIGRGYPKEPPNYLGFRFEGRLQQIRHVDSYQVADDNHAGFEPLEGKVNWPDDRHWVFQLGPVITPSKEVRTGGLYGSHRGWIAIDLLLTCDTVAEALEKTNARRDESGAIAI
jgi:hypothetical protein